MFNIYEALFDGVLDAFRKVGGAVWGSLISFVASGVMYWLFVVESPSLPVQYAELDAGRSRAVIVSGYDRPAGDLWGVMYSIVEGQTTVVGEHVVGLAHHCTGTLQFELVTALDGDLVGLIESTEPHRLLLTWQFSTQRGWRESNFDPLPSEEKDALREQVQELSRANAGRHFQHESLNPQPGRLLRIGPLPTGTELP